MLKIGTDLDGVIACNSLNVVDYRPFKLHEYYSHCKPTKLSKMPIDVIVTGRKLHFRKLTERWLRLHGVNYKELIMFPNKIKKTNESLAKYKAETINRLGIEVYFEDDQRIGEQMKKICLNTKIILVETPIKKVNLREI